MPRRTTRSRWRLRTVRRGNSDQQAHIELPCVCVCTNLNSCPTTTHYLRSDVCIRETPAIATGAHTRVSARPCARPCASWRVKGLESRVTRPRTANTRHEAKRCVRVRLVCVGNGVWAVVFESAHRNTLEKAHVEAELLYNYTRSAHMRSLALAMHKNNDGKWSTTEFLVRCVGHVERTSHSTVVPSILTNGRPTDVCHSCGDLRMRLLSVSRMRLLVP
jgi:hypothetical protein